MKTSAWNRGYSQGSELEMRRRAMKGLKREESKKKGVAWLPLIAALVSTYFAATGGETGIWIVAGIFWMAFFVFSKK